MKLAITTVFLGSLIGQQGYSAPKGNTKSPSSAEVTKEKEPEEPSTSTAASEFDSDHSQGAPTPDSRSWWNPMKMRHSIGVELADSSFGVLGTNAINYAYSTDKFGVEVYFGYAKGSDTTSINEVTTSNTLADPKTQSIVKTYDGEKNPKQISFGVQPKLVLFSDKWFRTTAGLMIARVSSSSVSYQTGSTTTTFADTSKPKNYSVTNADLGSISKTTSARLIYGPRINTDFYLKWFPHLSLGFGTGLLLSSSGDVTETTSTADKTYSVVDGVDQKATSESSSSSTKKTTTGGSASTVALGGTKFSLLGSFSLRYIW